MKKLAIITIVGAIYSLAATAADYTCNKSIYRFDLSLHSDKSTFIRVEDSRNYSFLFQSYAKSIERGKIASSFYFYPASTEELVMSFRNSDIKNKPNKIRAHVDAFIDGFIVKGYLNCHKR